MATRRRTWALAVVAVVALAVLGWVAYAYFLPKGSTTVDEDFRGGEALKSGAFRDGDALHNVAGTVTLYRAPDGAHYLRFEDYEATDGPDVYYYLTTRAGARATADVESGFRVLVPGGADGGEATVRGTFDVPLPAGFDPSAYNGLAVWCDRFNTLFGSAALDAAA